MVNRYQIDLHRYLLLGTISDGQVKSVLMSTVSPLFPFGLSRTYFHRLSCRVEEAYRRMEDPGCVVIDASASREAVLKNTLSIIKRHCNI